jgi:hypothetical protein
MDVLVAADRKESFLVCLKVKNKPGWKKFLAGFVFEEGFYLIPQL